MSKIGPHTTKQNKTHTQKMPPYLNNSMHLTHIQRQTYTHTNTHTVHLAFSSQIPPGKFSMLSEKKERINKKKQFYRSKKKNDITKRNQKKSLRKQTTNYAIDKQRTQKASKIRS